MRGLSSASCERSAEKVWHKTRRIFPLRVWGGEETELPFYVDGKALQKLKFN